jgi:hypothetical protein
MLGATLPFPPLAAILAACHISLHERSHSSGMTRFSWRLLSCTRARCVYVIACMTSTRFFAMLYIYLINFSGQTHAQKCGV